MASTRQQLDKLLKLMDTLEEDLFDDNERYMYYAGELYTRNEWHNFKRAIMYVRKKYIDDTYYSSSYLSAHRDYNKIMRMLCYYRGKDKKRTKDYLKIEELEEKLTEIKLRYSLEREEKRKLEKQEIERIRKELNDTEFFDN